MYLKVLWVAKIHALLCFSTHLHKEALLKSFVSIFTCYHLYVYMFTFNLQYLNFAPVVIKYHIMIYTIGAFEFFF